MPIHKSILGTNYVSNAEISNFSQGQVIRQIDPREIGSAFHRAGAEIAEKGHFWMETN